MDQYEFSQYPHFQECLDFHGHLCPGLALGYKASMLAMSWLESRRAADEEIVAIAETDACGCDAVQIITGCTFGKGNFLYRDYGKTAFTFFSRISGKGVRVAKKAEGEDPLNPEHRQLLDKLRLGTADEQDRARFKELHDAASYRVLEASAEEMFTLTEIAETMPKKAVIQASINCSRCGEPTMPAKMESVDDELVCRGCMC